MNSYNYTAINEKGRTVRGTISAENELDLEARLQQARLDLVNSKLAKERRAKMLSKVRIKDLIVFCMHMEQLERAGVPMHEALADIRDSTESDKLRDILTGVLESIKSGSMLSTSLAEHPKTFSNVFIGLIEAGEKTGRLADSYYHLGEHMKWVSEIRRKVKKAVRYPAVLLVVISLVITVLMLYVVPKLLDFITSQGFTIPWHTYLLIDVSNAFVNQWYLIFGIPLAVIMIIMVLHRSSAEAAYKLDNLFLNMPIFGPVIRKIDMARFTHFFSIMFNSGIDILDSLKAARGVVKNRVLKESIDFVQNNVMDGNSLTNSLRMTNQFPVLVIRMFKVGEDSGNMHQALENVNFFYDREVNDAVDGLVGMIQPTLTVVMGTIIFWIIAAVFGPLYESFGQMDF